MRDDVLERLARWSWKYGAVWLMPRSCGMSNRFEDLVAAYRLEGVRVGEYGPGIARREHDRPAASAWPAFEPAGKLDAAIGNADEALSRAKVAGRNRVVVARLDPGHPTDGNARPRYRQDCRELGRAG